MVYKNLENTFLEKTPIVLKKIEKSFYKHFSALILNTKKVYP